MARARKKTHYLSLAQKQQLLKEWDRKLVDGKHVTLEVMALWAASHFGLPFIPHKSTISRIGKNRSKIYAAQISDGRKKGSRVACPALDTDLSDWVCDQYNRGLVVTEDTIVVHW